MSDLMLPLQASGQLKQPAVGAACACYMLQLHGRTVPAVTVEASHFRAAGICYREGIESFYPAGMT